jgi:hypothetical protein
MLAFFKVLFVGVVMMAEVIVFSALPDESLTGGSGIRGVIDSPKSILLALVSSGESVADEDTTKAENHNESEEEKESYRISITDKGIKIDAGKGQEFIFELDSTLISGEILKELGESQREILEKWRGGVIDIPESLREKLEGLRERRFKEVRGDDLVRFGEDVHVGWDELVRGDVVTIFGEAKIDGKVMGDVVSVMGDVELSSSAIVNGQVVSILGDLSKEEGARVRGETVMVGHGSPNISLGLPVLSARGKVIRVLIRVIMLIVGILLMGIVIAFLPERMDRSSKCVFGSFFKSLGIGALVVFVGSILVGIVCVIFAITVIGIPIAILLGISYAVFFLLGYFVSAYAIGKVVVAKLNLQTKSLFVRGFIGIFVLCLLGLIARVIDIYPFMDPLSSVFSILGGFISFIALLTGVGAIILSKGGKLTVGEKKKVPQELEDL